MSASKGQATAPLPADILVRHGYIITMDAERRLIPDGAIAIAGGKIIAVGEDADIASRFFASQVIDAEGAPVHPGFIECHMHASFQLYRGALPDHLAESDAFDTVEAQFYNTVNDEEEYLSVLLSAIEMVRSGTTCFLEAGTVLTPKVGSARRKARGDQGDPEMLHLGSTTGVRAGQAEQRRQSCKACASHGRVHQELKRAPKTKAEALAVMGQELRRNSHKDALVRGHVAILGLGTASGEPDEPGQGLCGCCRGGPQPAPILQCGRYRGGLRPFGKDPLVHLAETDFLTATSSSATATISPMQSARR